jgi:hypothetical protein
MSHGREPSSTGDRVNAVSGSDATTTASAKGVHYNDVIDALLVGPGAECDDVETLRIHNSKLVFVIRKLAESQVRRCHDVSVEH